MILNKEQKQEKNDMRILLKQFRFLEEYHTRLVYEFSEFEYDRAYRVLTVLKDDPTPLVYIKYMVDNPQKSQQTIMHLQKTYYQKYQAMQTEKLDQNYSQNQLQDKDQQTKMILASDQLGYDFFEQVPSDVCLNIMSFLDPRSFSNMACVNSHFYKYSRSKLSNEYFKILCIALFEKLQPQMPVNCVFEEVRDYVVSHPIQFGQNYRNAVNNNLRYFVWKMQASSFKIDNKFYKSFGNYRSLFLQCPRIHLNGYYVCKEKHVRLGQKNYMTHTTPIYVVYYYRYIRLFQDGSLLYYVSSRKPKLAKIRKILSKQNRMNFNPKNQDGLMIGEYMHYKNNLFVKSSKYNTIFGYQFQIQSSQHRLNNNLKVNRYTLELVDEKQMVQILYEAKPNRQQLYFRYYIDNQIAEQNNSKKSICDV